MSSDRNNNYDGDSPPAATAITMTTKNRPDILLILQWLLLVFNLLLSLTGMVLLGAGVWFLVDSRNVCDFFNIAPSFAPFHPSVRPLLKAAGIPVTVTAGLAMFGGIVGVCNTVRTHQAILTLYITLVMFTSCGLFTIGIVAATDENWVRSAVQDFMQDEADQSLIASSGKVVNGLLMWSNQKFNCCGIETEINETCTQDYPGINCQEGSELCSKGCLDEIWIQLVHPVAQLAAIISLITCGILVLAIVLSLLACCKRHYSE